VEMVGGIFGVESAPGNGTTITAEIPLSGKMSKKQLRLPPVLAAGIKRRAMG